MAQTIADKGAGKPMDRLLLADALGIKPASSNYRELLRAGFQYGVTKGSEHSEEIALSDLGTRCAKPTYDGERAAALVEIIQKPALAAKIYAHYDRNKWPDAKFLKHTLERQFAVESDRSEWVAQILEANAKAAGCLRNISGSTMLMLNSAGEAVPPPIASESSLLPNQTEEVAPTTSPTNGNGRGNGHRTTNGGSTTSAKPVKSAIFIGHGKNPGPLKQLTEILDRFKIPYKVAVHEPNEGLPIPEKVRKLMDECSSAILIFSKDECLFDKDGQEVWRPSQNAVHELGAASALYDRRIIIFKEDGVELPTNFSSIGNIGFKDGDLKAKAVELLQELIRFGLVAILPAGTA